MLPRQILFAVSKTSEEDDPLPGLDYLMQEILDYWDRRQTIIAISMHRSGLVVFDIDQNHLC